ncbi:MAG: hypothetical protein Q4G35_08310 [Propionibacteriaceae bacterium]|nr:hypothetical protein [Propionibacteriaceae bacterium]
MARFARKNHANSHSYTLDGHRIPGVTTIIGILDKPALVGWAAKETAAYADEHWTELSALRSADRIERLTKARFATNRRAIVRGNRVHALGERLFKGEEIPEGDISPELRPWVEGYARFLDEWEFEFIATEMPLCSTDYRYGGTADGFAWSPRLGNVLLDLKTGKGVYGETALQLAAYRYADLGLSAVEKIGPRGGRSTVWEECPVPQVDTTVVAHIREDGTSLIPVKGDEETHEAFLYMATVYDLWVRRTDWNNRSDADALRAVADPIYPEDFPRKDIAS